MPTRFTGDATRRTNGSEGGTSRRGAISEVEPSPGRAPVAHDGGDRFADRVERLWHRTLSDVDQTFEATFDDADRAELRDAWENASDAQREQIEAMTDDEIVERILRGREREQSTEGESSSDGATDGDSSSSSDAAELYVDGDEYWFATSEARDEFAVALADEIEAGDVERARLLELIAQHGGGLDPIEGGVTVYVKRDDDGAVADDAADFDVPDGSIDVVLTWVGDNTTRAQAALDIETSSEQPRKTLVEKLEGLTGADSA